MKLRETLSRKPVKFLTLLLTAMLVATASAAVYYSLTMTSTIAVATPSVYFVKGVDNVTAGVNLSVDNKTAQLTQLKAYPNVTTTYDDPIRVRNNHTSLSFNIRLRHVSLTGAATNFIFVNFTLIGDTGTRSLDYTSNGTDWTYPSPTSTQWIPIDADEEFKIKVETKAKAGAATGTVTIEIAVDVE